MSNDFLNPVHAALTSEWQAYPDLAKKVNAKIASGEMDSGCHDCCSFSWFAELTEEGRAEMKIEPIFRGKVQKGSRHYFRRKACKYGDELCPCQDGDMCHYEGPDPMIRKSA